MTLVFFFFSEQGIGMSSTGSMKDDADGSFLEDKVSVCEA